jgi:FolB domain-containing protein
MDQTFITDLLCRGVIGITDRERAQPQDILVNVVIFSDTTRAAASDNIDDCVNYRTVAKNVLSHVERAQKFTVEALAAEIAAICLQETGAQKVRVRIEKPGAVRFARSVGVEIERTPADLKR